MVAMHSCWGSGSRNIILFTPCRPESQVFNSNMIIIERDLHVQIQHTYVPSEKLSIPESEPFSFVDKVLVHVFLLRIPESLLISVLDTKTTYVLIGH